MYLLEWLVYALLMAYLPTKLLLSVVADDVSAEEALALASRMLATARNNMLALLIHALLVAYECILLIRVFPSVVAADALAEGIRWAFRAKRAVAAAMTAAAEWCELAVAEARAGCEAAACERRASAPVEETARAVAGEETAGGHAAPDAGQQGGAGWGRFLLEAPYELLCPITRDVMIDPVMAGDGNYYQRAAIEEWFNQHSRSPLTGEELPGVCSHCRSNPLVPCVTLRKLCQDWLE